MNTYAALCLFTIVFMVLRGDGPHPRVVGTYPVSGFLTFPGGAAEMTFSEFMDQTSVQRALQVTPGGLGQAIWRGTTLVLQPIGDWRPNRTYRIILSGRVTDTEGRPLKMPVSFSFHVHHVRKAIHCLVSGVQNVCDASQPTLVLTHERLPVHDFALSPDGRMLAYTRSMQTGTSNLFLTNLDGSGTIELTRDSGYSDSSPRWSPGNMDSVNYERHSVRRCGNRICLGPKHLWNVETSGSLNMKLR